MPGMLVKDNTVSLKNSDFQKVKSHTCRNCGEIHSENLEICPSCKFPNQSNKVNSVQESRKVFL